MKRERGQSTALSSSARDAKEKGKAVPMQSKPRDMLDLREGADRALSKGTFCIGRPRHPQSLRPISDHVLLAIIRDLHRDAS